MPSGTETFTAANGSAPASPWIVSASGATVCNIQSNKLHYVTVAGYAGMRARYGSRSYTDTLVEVDFSFQASVEVYGEINIRHSGGFVGSTGDTPRNGYTLSLQPFGNVVNCERRISEALTTLDTRAFTFTTGVTYRAKFEAVGTTIRYKLWDASSGEPGSWTFSTTDSTFSAGLWSLCGSGNGAYSIDYDNVAWTATYSDIPVQVDFSAASVASITTGNIAWPVDHGPDDVALMFIESCGGEAVTLSNAQGFTAMPNSPSATGTTTNGTRVSVWWHRATSNAMSSPAVADPGDHFYGLIVTFGNVVTAGNPYDTSAAAVKASASTSMTLPAVTTTVPNCYIVLAAARDNDSALGAGSGYTNAGLANLVELHDAGTALGNGGGLMIVGGIKTAAGSTGTTSATVTSSINAYHTTALAPVVAASTFARPPIVRIPLAILAR